MRRLKNRFRKVRLPNISWNPSQRIELLRATGLALLNEKILKTGVPEPKKRIVKISLWLAFQRSLIHMFPIGASIAIIILNWIGIFIGGELAGIPGKTTISLALLQILAKTVELLIVSSLAAVVFHRTRHDLLHDGVSFGFLGSGLAFTTLNYFWSVEFWGGLRKASISLLLLVMMSGLLALTAGPSFAVLVIPRELTWHAGGARFWLNGTTQALWPSNVGLEHHSPGCSEAPNLHNGSTLPDLAVLALCPSGGFGPLRQHYASANSRGLGIKFSLTSTFNWRDVIPPPTDLDTQFSTKVGLGILIESPGGLIVPYVLTGSIRGWSAVDTVTYGVPGAIANFQNYLNLQWSDAADAAHGEVRPRDRFRFYSSQISRIRTLVPAVRVACGTGRFTVANSTVKADFPVLPTFEQFNRSRNDMGFTPIFSREIPELKSQNFTTLPRVHWQEMISNPTRGWSATTGIVFESPWLTKIDANSSEVFIDGRFVSGCTVDARWANAWTVAQQQRAVQSQIDPNYLARVVPYEHPLDLFRPKNGSWKEIRISHEWLDAINFELQGVDLGQLPQGTRALDALIATLGLSYDEDTISDNRNRRPNTLSLVEHVIASALADGLSRVASFRSLNLSFPQDEFDNRYPYTETTPDATEQFFTGGNVFVPPPADPDAPFTSLRIEEYVTGYSYKVSAVTDYLAIGVLLSYIIIAFSHILYTLGTRRSSGTWDTLSELLAIAMQSPPSRNALTNTCAGLNRIRHFGERMWVRVKEDQQDHLVLMFEADGAPLIGATKVDPNVEYGNIDRRV